MDMAISLARAEPCEFHSVGLKLVQKSLDIGPKNLLASLCLSRRKAQVKNEEELPDRPEALVRERINNRTSKRPVMISNGWRAAA
jgi:hypothetical protein